MKRLFIIPWLFILTGVGLLCFAMADSLGWRAKLGEGRLSIFFEDVEPALEGPVSERASIAFILGEDEDSTNQFYAEAANYYRLHPSDRTDEVLTHCRSLGEVFDYLANHRPANGMPWGRIHLVAHGNEWSGLAVPPMPGEGRTTAASLAAAEALRPLPDAVADACTELHVEGCGVGRDTALLAVLRQKLGGVGEQPEVLSSPHFIHFSSEKRAGQPTRCRKELQAAWYAFYPKTYRPDNPELARRLKKAYPDAQLDWQAALQRTTPAQPGGAYCHEFDLPVVWVVAYPEGHPLPDLSKWREQRQWLLEQPELLSKLRAYGLPLDNFQWTFLPTTHRLGDGTEVPAIRAIGLCTVLTVLQGVSA